MTLPQTIRLPSDPARQRIVLENMYEDLAIHINGRFHTNDSIGSAQFLPQIFGAGTAGAGTYATDKQIGWVLRQGIIIDVWFDVTWTGHTGSGNMYLQLPYKVANSLEKPFVGVLQASNITATGTDYLVCNAIPDTYRLEIWSCTTAAATANVAIDTAGQIMGHIRYVGQDREF